MSKLDAFKSFFTNTATGRGACGFASAMLISRFCTGVLGASVSNTRDLDKAVVPIFTFTGLFYDPYTRFDDKLHLGFTALTSCWAVWDAYKGCGAANKRIDNKYAKDLREISEIRRAGRMAHPTEEGDKKLERLDKREKEIEKVRWQDKRAIISAIPANIAFFSLLAKGALELGRCAVSYCNGR